MILKVSKKSVGNLCDFSKRPQSSSELMNHIYVLKLMSSNGLVYV